MALGGWVEDREMPSRPIARGEKCHDKDEIQESRNSSSIERRWVGDAVRHVDVPFLNRFMVAPLWAAEVVIGKLSGHGFGRRRRGPAVRQAELDG
jgi:hypothetical protein